MAIKGLSFFEEDRFSSKLDAAEADTDKTWFVSAPLPLKIRTYINDNTNLQISMGDGQIGWMSKGSSRNVMACKFGLKRIENMSDGDGVPIKVEFEDFVLGDATFKVVKDSVLEKIPPVIIGELGDHIMTLNVLSEDMRKKLLTP